MKQTKEHIQKRTEKNKGQKRSLEFKENRQGKGNPNWKGGQAKYHAIHSWIRTHKVKTKFCEDCKKIPPIDLANISQKYKRDITDFEWLCRRCHMKKDGRLKIFNPHAKTLQ